MAISNIVRKAGETAVIGNNIRVSILEVNGEQVRMRIEAPGGLSIQKEEECRSRDPEKLRAAELEAEREAAWQTYLQHEQELLRDHYGEYVWVLPGEIRAVCRTQEELCTVLVEQKSGGRGIAFQIEKRQPRRVIEVSSPEVEYGQG